MNRKTLIACAAVAAVLLLAIAGAVMVLYSDVEPENDGRMPRPAGTARVRERAPKPVKLDESALSVMKAVPTDAAAVFDFGTFEQTASSLLDGTKAFGAFSAPINGYLSALISGGMPEKVGRMRSVVSLHYGGTLTPLLVIEAGAVPDTSQLLVTLVKASEGSGIVTRVVPSRFGTFFLASPSEANVVSSARHLEARSSILDDKSFARAVAANQGSANLFFSNAYAGKIVPSYIQRPYSSCSDFLRTFADWTVLSIVNGSEERLTMGLKGICGKGQSYYSNMVDGLAASDCDMPSVLPAGTFFAVDLCLQNSGSYRSAYELYLDSNARLTDASKALEWAAQTGFLEVVNASWKGADGSLLRANFIKLPKGAKTEGDITGCTFTGFLADLFGKQFELEDESMVSGRGCWLISGDAKALKDAAASGTSLEEMLQDVDLDGVIPSRACGPVVYFNASQLSDELGSIFKGDALSSMERLLSGVTVCPMCLSRQKDGWKMDAARCSSRLSSIQAPVNIEVSRGPFKVRNSGTGRTNLFYQNENLYLCLKEESGKGIWGVSFDTPICGAAAGVDYYSNGKIQFAFCAGSSLYLIDRLGRFVSGFPVDLGKTVLLGPSVYKSFSGQGYSIVVLHGDNTIEMYDLQGQKPSSWKGITCPDAVTGLPVLVTEGGNRYWEVPTSAKTYTYDLWGGNPLNKKK